MASRAPALRLFFLRGLLVESLVVSKWRRRGCANKNTNGNWSGQSSALLICTRIGAPLAGVNPSLSSPLTPPMQFDPAPIPLWAWLLRCSQCAVRSVQCACAVCICLSGPPPNFPARWPLSGPLSRTPGGNQWPQILFQRRERPSGPASIHPRP